MSICETRELFQLGPVRIMWAGPEIPANHTIVIKRPGVFGTETLETIITAVDRANFTYENPAIYYHLHGLVGEKINKDPFSRRVVHFVPSKHAFLHRLFIIRAA